MKLKNVVKNSKYLMKSKVECDEIVKKLEAKGKTVHYMDEDELVRMYENEVMVQSCFVLSCKIRFSNISNLFSNFILLSPL